jgi:hypothetical protein
VARKINDRVKEAFQESDKEQAIKFLDWLRPTILDYAASIRRTSLAIILLVAVFELVISSKGAKVTIGSFEIARNSVVLVFLPALIAYLYMQTAWDSARSDYLTTAFTTIFKVWSPNAEKNDLDDLLTPAQLMYYSAIGGAIRSENKRPIDKIDDRTSFIFYGIFFFGTFIFEGQAYFVLFPHHLGEAFSWAISLSIAIFCLFVSVLIFYQLATEEY